MYDMIILYSVPQDPAVFDAYYTTEHARLVGELPLLREFSWGKAENPEETGCYLVARLTYASAEDAQESMASEAGQASVKDLENFAQAGVQVINVLRGGETA